MAKAAPNPTRSPSKRDTLVETALRLFEAEGYHATGIDRIIDEACVAKMTLYNHFRSKDELILAALRLRDERFRNWLARRVRELAADPADRLIALFDAAGEWFASESFNGCIFARACAEFAEPDHPVRAAAQEHCRLLMRDFVALAGDTGAPDPKHLAEMMMILYDGAVTAAQTAGCPSAAARARDAARIIVDASMERKR